MLWVSVRAPAQSIGANHIKVQTLRRRRLRNEVMYAMDAWALLEEEARDRMRSSFKET